MDTENHKPNLGGRPKGLYEYSELIRDKICSLLASGMTLRAVCRLDGMPDRQTIYNWLYVNVGEVKDDEGKVIEEGFFDHYTRAREVGLDEVADENLEIADDGTNDFVEVETKKGERKIIYDRESVQRSDLRVRTRQWYLENMAPRKYGKNVTIKDQKLDKSGEPQDQPGSGTDEFMKSIADAIKSGERKADLDGGKQ